MIREAITIRTVENKFLSLFAEGKLNGTVHTSVGQEFSAIAFAGQLKSSDFVFSNHRCHGHYISFTKDITGLIAELLGKKSGICGGIGSSQHLQNGNFYSNGIQGGIVPLAAGYSLANQLNNDTSIGVVFIGDGTLGEGIVYETFNIVSKWKIPLIIVCEDNHYAQSTPSSKSLAGSIVKRAESFGIKTAKGATNRPEELILKAKSSIDLVRGLREPLFFHVDTYRLNAHSKGDDDRSIEEIDQYSSDDYINKFAIDNPKYYSKLRNEIVVKVDKLAIELLNDDELTLSEYFEETLKKSTYSWNDIEEVDERLVQRINLFFHDAMSKDEKIVFMGEDVHSPYGGAFKVSKDLSLKYPERVFTTPISEAAITGIANGMALNGYKPFVEIMFGDFITLAFDQIINHASKFHHMYNKKVNCPVVIRTPMGGGRGYGPTHSQSLEKYLLGIENAKTIAINSLIDPLISFKHILKEQNPIIVIENKTEYGKKIKINKSKYFRYVLSDHDYPIVKVEPKISNPEVTIVTYGKMGRLVTDHIEQLFIETDLKIELLVLTQLCPIQIEPIIESLQKSKRLLTIEEGNGIAGFGSEVISLAKENLKIDFNVERVSALPVPIPSVKNLEEKVLPSLESIIVALNNLY